MNSELKELYNRMEERMRFLESDKAALYYKKPEIDIRKQELNLAIIAVQQKLLKQIQ